MTIAQHFQATSPHVPMIDTSTLRRHHTSGPVMATPLVAVVSVGVAGFVGGYVAGAIG